MENKKFCPSKVKCCCIISVLFLTILYIYCYKCIYYKPFYEAINSATHDCKFFQNRMLTLSRLTNIVHDTLDKNNIMHFILYGSIWGPLRGYKGPLPWDYDVDLGTLETGSTKANLDAVRKEVRKFGIASKECPESGLIKFYYEQINCNSDCPSLDLFVFKKTWFGLVRRTGYEPWLLAVHYYFHHTFPYKLISNNLPKVPFAGRKIQTPRGGIEIMKWLYRYNWRENRKPQKFNCSITYA